MILESSFDKGSNSSWAKLILARFATLCTVLISILINAPEALHSLLMISVICPNASLQVVNNQLTILRGKKYVPYLKEFSF
jgi:hypothetical protein